ncbi:MAG: prenyltransferase [Polyangiaceae bacterium]
MSVDFGEPRTPSLFAWLQAARPLAAANIALPILFGSALAYGDQRRFSAGALGLALGFGVLDQLFIVFANDYADAEADQLNTTYNLFSGGSRVIPQGKLSRSSLGRAALLMAALLLIYAAAVGLMADVSVWFPLTLAALFLLWAYSFPPIRLSFRGGGELLQALGLGVVLPLIGFSAQTGGLGDLSWTSLMPAFLIGYAGNITTALPDHPADAATGKFTYAVRASPRVARRNSLILIGCAALGTPIIVPDAGYTRVTTLIALVVALLLANLRQLDAAEASNHPACRLFVLLNGAAISLLFGGWALLLWLGG